MLQKNKIVIHDKAQIDIHDIFDVIKQIVFLKTIPRVSFLLFFLENSSTTTESPPILSNLSVLLSSSIPEVLPGIQSLFLENEKHERHPRSLLFPPTYGIPISNDRDTL
jgi:hypothetical protein